MGQCKFRLSSANFHIIEEHFEMLPHPVIIVIMVMLILAIVSAIMSPKWFPCVARMLYTSRHTRWLCSPQFGYLLPFTIVAFIFPIAGLFSSNIWTVWLFLLFGWGIAAILLYTGYLLDRWR